MGEEGEEELEEVVRRGIGRGRGAPSSAATLAMEAREEEGGVLGKYKYLQKQIFFRFIRNLWVRYLEKRWEWKR